MSCGVLKRSREEHKGPRGDLLGSSEDPEGIQRSRRIQMVQNESRGDLEGFIGDHKQSTIALFLFNRYRPEGSRDDAKF